MDRRPNCNRGKLRATLPLLKVINVGFERIPNSFFWRTLLVYFLLSGQIVPIFANNKKKRLRQALYASPTKAEQTEDFEDLNSHNEWNDGDDGFETNDAGPQKQSFPRSQKSDSVIKVGNINDSLPSVCFSSRQSHYSSNGFDCIGNNGKGLQVPIRLPIKHESQHHSVDSVHYNDVRFATNNFFLLFLLV